MPPVKRLSGAFLFFFVTIEMLVHNTSNKKTEAHHFGFLFNYNRFSTVD
jgi:hypothetical protein